jgi:Outer membrane protein beta-barrel domain
MKRITIPLVVLILFLASFPAQVFSQPFTTKYELGASLGLFVYQGDLTPEAAGSFRTARLGLNLNLNRILNNAFALRTNLAVAGLRGDDSRYSNPEFRKQRNFNFRSPLAEISESAIWTPIGNNDRIVQPYLMAGIGLSFLQIKRDWSNFNAEYFSNAPEIASGLSVDQQHRVPWLIPVIPVGIGFRHAITSGLSVTGEAAYRFTFTDYLDGFSQAANPERKDHYSSYSIGVLYKMGRKNRLNCPPVPR